MDANEFRKRGREMVDYIADYMDGIAERRVLPEVQPGYLRDMLPNRAPQKPEDWDSIMRDVDHAIMPGVSKLLHVNMPCEVFFYCYYACYISKFTLTRYYVHRCDVNRLLQVGLVILETKTKTLMISDTSV